MPEENKPAEQPKTEALSMVERAEISVKAMKEQNDRYEELVKRNEEAAARTMLGGQTQAGQPQEKQKEETPAEYTKRIMAGNGKYGES